MSIFEKFDKALNTEELAKEVNELKTNGQTFERTPHGKYEVKLDKLEIVECKSEKHKGEPMIKGIFKIIAGDHKGKLIFMNQLIVSAFQIHLMNQFLKSLDTGLDISFTNYSNYAYLLKDIEEECEKLEFVLNYSTDKGFDKFTIEAVFEV